jgi:hypothetical protein
MNYALVEGSLDVPWTVEPKVTASSNVTTSVTVITAPTWASYYLHMKARAKRDQGGLGELLNHSAVFIG